MNALTDTSIFPTTRLTLLARLNDPAAEVWDDFFGVYGPLIYRMARHARLDEHASEEIVAEVMRNFVGSVAAGFAFDPRRGRFRNYLRTITNRSIRNHRGRQARGACDMVEFPVEIVPDDCEAPDERWQQAEREERWQACLERLRSSSAVSPRDMEAFDAYVLRQEPAHTVARRLGIKVDRLYTIKHELIRRLRQIREQLDTELGEA